eukprot:jgi/Ulvmu1/1505/UM011_0235.1
MSLPLSFAQLVFICYTTHNQHPLSALTRHHFPCRKSTGSWAWITFTSVCRNRCFRCLFCKKVPPSDNRVVGSPFVLTHRLTKCLLGVCEEQQWLRSLACNVSCKSRLLTFGAVEKARCSALLETPQVISGLGGLPHSVIASTSPVGKTSPAPKAHSIIRGPCLTKLAFADVTEDATVPVKWQAGVTPTSEKLAFLKRAAPDLLDIARQLLGYDINVRKICVLSDHGLVSFDLCAPPGSRAANYCMWEQRFHKSNFTMLKVDFWYGTCTVHCWDPECRKKHSGEWFAHLFWIPQHLRSGKALFDEPPTLDGEELRDMLVYADGSSDPVHESALLG